jgi:hypothetical protein
MISFSGYGRWMEFFTGAEKPPGRAVSRETLIEKIVSLAANSNAHSAENIPGYRPSDPAALRKRAVIRHFMPGH